MNVWDVGKTSSMGLLYLEAIEEEIKREREGMC